MLTVKAFWKDNKGLYCDPDGKKHYYKVGKEYVVDRERVKICKFGFHASAHCDISETLYFYDITEHTAYCLVDINVVDEHRYVVVGDRISIIKELTFDECVQYDKTGEWCYEYAGKIKGADIKRLQDAVIEKDKYGELCYRFAKYVEGADIKRLQDAVIEKDKEGEYCYKFGLWVEGCDINTLQDAVIEKDKYGDWCYLFASDVFGADIKKLKDALIKKDKDSLLRFEFDKLLKTNKP